MMQVGCLTFKVGSQTIPPLWASLVAQMVKNLPVVWETRVWSLGREDPLEKEMATHSSILAWRIPWKEEPACYNPWHCKELDMTEWVTDTYTCTCTPIPPFYLGGFSMCILKSRIYHFQRTLLCWPTGLMTQSTCSFSTKALQ